jgi:Flp pilus assembly pilin Flp
MLKYIRNFRRADSGAVTVDWVILAGVIVALAAAVTPPILELTSSGSEDIAAELSDHATKSY